MTGMELVLSVNPVLAAQRNQYLLGNQFKINMSHVVKDLAVLSGPASR